VGLHNGDGRQDLFNHLLKRNEQRVHGGRPPRFEVCNDTKLIQLRDLSTRCELRLSVFAVQPGVPQAKIRPSQLGLLSVADRYLSAASLLQANHEETHSYAELSTNSPSSEAKTPQWNKAALPPR